MLAFCAEYDSQAWKGGLGLCFRQCEDWLHSVLGKQVMIFVLKQDNVGC